MQLIQEDFSSCSRCLSCSQLCPMLGCVSQRRLLASFGYLQLSVLAEIQRGQASSRGVGPLDESGQWWHVFLLWHSKTRFPIRIFYLLALFLQVRLSPHFSNSGLSCEAMAAAQGLLVTTRDSPDEQTPAAASQAHNMVLFAYRWRQESRDLVVVNCCVYFASHAWDHEYRLGWCPKDIKW